MNHQLQQTYGRLNTPFLLLNKVVCSKCQQYLVCKNASTQRAGRQYKYQYYICGHCSYKLLANELQQVVCQKLIRFIKQLLSDDEQLHMIRQSIQQHQECLEHCIESVENKLDILLTKEALAETHSDQKLLKLIAQKNEELIHERKVLQSKQQLLDTMQDALDDGSFTNRFLLISEKQLSDQELRLLILYFIESVNVSSSSPPTIRFTSDVLRDLI